jgi:ABC-2 type transport system permease protein
MATVAVRARPSGHPRWHGALAPLTRRALRDSRGRTLAFSALFLLTAYGNPTGYAHTYTTVVQRMAFAHSFAHNKAVVLFYGRAYDLLTVGGYSAWRTGGTLAILAAVFGLMAAVRALRAEEESGRSELVLSAPVGRRTNNAAALTAAAVGTCALWLAVVMGSLLGDLPLGGSAYLGLAIVSVVPVFLGGGALASQIAPTRRTALELGGVALGIFFLLRVIADTSGGLSWLRWLTPLGWAEEMRPFTGARPLVLLAPIALSILLLTLSWAIANRRDVGNGLVTVRDVARPRLALLRSPLAHAFRGERTSLIVWIGGVGVLGLVEGIVSKSISSAGIPRRLAHELSKVGAGSILTPRGYIGFTFIFFVLLVSLFVVAQVSAARHEESGGRLENLLSLPIGRGRWLGGRLLLAAATALLVALAAGILTWIGAISQGVHLSLPLMLEAGLNCLPVALLFLGVSALLYAVVPRASSGASYGLLALLYLWQLIGALVGVPRWLADATPFAHVGLVPAAAFQGLAAGAMVAVGLAAGGLAIALFRRRDLSGA